MTRTLRKVAVLLAVAILGVAFAAGPSTNTSTTSTQTPASAPGGPAQTVPPTTPPSPGTPPAARPGTAGIVGKALENTEVTLLAGAPGSGAAVLLTRKASQLTGRGTGPLADARFATLSVGGHGISFAVASAGSGASPIELAVTGVPGSPAASQVSLTTVATYLYDAVDGNAAAVVLERGHGASAVAFAVYDPAKPAATLAVSGATQAIAIVDGRVTSYRVREAGGGVANLVVASGSHQGQRLSAVIG